VADNARLAAVLTLRRYNKLAGHITSLVAKLKALPQDNALRVKTTEALLTKLYNLGLIPVANSLAAAERIAASAFCRRRLPVVMMRLKFAESLREAVQFVEQVSGDNWTALRHSSRGMWRLLAPRRRRCYRSRLARYAPLRRRPSSLAAEQTRRPMP
jgi:hypothetical protein